MPDTAPPVSMRDALSKAVQQDAKSGDVVPKETLPPKAEPETPPPAREDKADGLSEYDRELLADLEADLSHMTPEDRARLEPLIVKFRKPYDKAFHRSREDALLGKRLRDAVAARPQAFERIKAFLDGKTEEPPPSVMTTEKKISLRGMDKLIEESKDPEVKKSLMESKQVLVEELQSQLESLLEPIKKELSSIKESHRTGRMQEVLAEVDELEDSLGYPSATVEKYREQLIELGLQYPNSSLEEILWKIVPLSELKPIVSKKESKAPPAVKLSSVSDSSSVKSDVKAFTDKRGTLDVRRMLRRLVPER